MKKIVLGLIALVILVIISSFYALFNHQAKLPLLTTWQLSIKEPVTYDVLFKSDKGISGDGDTILKFDSEKLDYKIECRECDRGIDLENDSKKLSEIIKLYALDNLINIKNLKIIDAVKQNKSSDSRYFKYLVITFDQNKKVYYIFESLI